MSRRHSIAAPAVSPSPTSTSTADLHTALNVDLLGVLFWTLCCIGILAIAYAAQSRPDVWDPWVDRVVSLIGK
jgi:hypothetical protein